MRRRAFLAVSRDGGTIYVAEGDSNLYVFDAASGAVTSTIPVGNGASSAAVTPDGVFAYVTNSVDNTVSKVSTNAATVFSTIKVDDLPQDVATIPLAPKKHKARWLRGVSCVSRTFCLAVGAQEAAPGTAALAEVRSGGQWRLTEPVSLPGALDTSLFQVSCRSATNCVAVGTAVTRPAVGGPASSVPLAAKWNGSAWASSLPPLPAGARGGELRHVSCTGSSGCIAVGSYANHAGVVKPLSERWNGRAWLLLSTPDARGAVAGRLAGVSCRASNCAAAGDFQNSSSGVDCWPCSPRCRAGPCSGSSRSRAGPDSLRCRACPAPHRARAWPSATSPPRAGYSRSPSVWPAGGGRYWPGPPGPRRNRRSTRSPAPQPATASRPAADLPRSIWRLIGRFWEQTVGGRSGGKTVFVCASDSQPELLRVSVLAAQDPCGGFTDWLAWPDTEEATGSIPVPPTTFA
jgi:YVTN family beta-propeller protein